MKPENRPTQEETTGHTNTHTDNGSQICSTAASETPRSCFTWKQRRIKEGTFFFLLLKLDLFSFKIMKPVSKEPSSISCFPENYHLKDQEYH